MKKLNDSISRQAAIDALANGALINYQAAGHDNGLVKAIDVIKGLPSAQPEHIRCKDCKNWQTDWTPICSDFTPEDHFCSLVDLVTEDDFFCGYAERKV